MRRQILVLTAILLVSLGAATAPGKAALSAQQILARTAENYRGVTGYALTGSVVTHMVIQDQPQDIDNGLKIAYGGPGRARFEAITPTERMVFIHSADSTFTYSSTFAQYSVEPRVVQPAAAGSVPTLDPNACTRSPAIPGSPTTWPARRSSPRRERSTKPSRRASSTSPTTRRSCLRQHMKPKRSRSMPRTSSSSRLDDDRPLVPRPQKPIHIEQSANFTDVLWNVAAGSCSRSSRRWAPRA